MVQTLQGPGASKPCKNVPAAEGITAQNGKNGCEETCHHLSAPPAITQPNRLS